MNIREYQVNDESILLDVLSLLIPEYFAKSELLDFKAYLQNELEYYYVVEIEDKIVGAGGFNVLEERNVVRISWDFVHTDFRGYGIGNRLISFRLNLIKELLPNFKVEVRTSQMAYLFYQKHGFKLKEVIVNYWAEGFDLYAMELV
ncbi:GNAT family N-acetyltransferase [Myroides guanonis]|uniref:N-acetylglutamate synthase, GNAT family n=1 Tax=Myroides guanonis TaxID=1150112 RepID=A0A1I3U9P5_9FLAO|nr:GNAT family N-acetyltransferase [Myroides guanonis]SFJ78481.1 N-acetylglutamate synthase, GNAT family [Myroides guanonis]